MLVLMVATFSPHPLPSILLDQLDDISHLHGGTVILVVRTVNISPVNWISRPAEYSIALTLLKSDASFGTNSQSYGSKAENGFDVFGIC
jgi:hypothetical protein